MNFKESYVLVKAKDFLPWPHAACSSFFSEQVLCVCPGAVFAVDKPSCVYVMSIITETLPLNQVLVLFSLASVKIHLSSINFSALASCGCLVAWCTILAARQVKTIHNIKRNAESVKLKENEPFLIF